MKIKQKQRILATCIAGVVGVALGSQAHAATEIWFGSNEAWNANQAWSTQTPGAGDTALFNGSGSGTNITVTANAPVGNITFDTAAAGSYSIGASNGAGIDLSSGGVIQMTSMAVNSETISAPILLNGTYAGGGNSGGSYVATLENNSTTATATLNIGNITGTAATGQQQGIELAAASNAGVQTISGGIGDGSNGGSVNVFVKGGTWQFSGANTYSGLTGIESGTLQVSSGANLGSSGSYITLVSGTLETLHSISTSRNINLHGAGDILDSHGNSDLFSGIIGSTNQTLNIVDSSGTGKGVITLSGNNITGGDYAPFFALVSGTLAITSDAAVGYSSSHQNALGILFEGGTLQFDNYASTNIAILLADPATYSPTNNTPTGDKPISIGAAAGDPSSYAGTINAQATGPNSVVYYQGPGTLILTGKVSYNTVLKNYGGVNNPAQWMLNGGTLGIETDAQVTGDIVTIPIATGAIPQISPGNGFAIFNGGTLQFQNYASNFSFNAANLGANAGGNIRLGAAAGAPSTLDGSITGALNLVYQGPGTLVLAGTDSYIGSTTVNAGLLETSSGSFGAGPIILNGGALAIANDAQIGNSPVYFNGGTLQFNNYASQLNFFEPLNNNSISLGAATGTASTLEGSISSGGAPLGGLIFQGPGTLILSAQGLVQQPFLGQTQILAGTLGTAGFGGSELTGPGGIYVASGAVFDISQANALFPITGLAGGGTVALGANSLEVNNSSVNTFSGTIQDAGLSRGVGGGLDKSGGGPLTLTGVNTYTGLTRVTGGALEVAIGGAITGGGGITVDGAGATFYAAGGNLLSGAINVTNGSFDAFQGAFVQSSSATIAAVAAEGNTPAFLTVDGNSVFKTGTLTVGSPTGGATKVNIDTGGAVEATTLNIAANGTVNILTSSLLQSDAVGSTNAGIISISGTGSLAGVSLTNTGTIFAVGGSTITAPLANNTGGLIHVSGVGNVTLSGDVTNFGTLTVDTGSGAVFTGTFSGSGAVTGTGTAFFDGTLSPGDPVVENFAGNVVLQGANNLIMQIGGTAPGTGYDQINVAGSATLGGKLTVQLINGFAPTLGESFQLIDPPSIGGAFTSFDLPSLSNGLQWNTSQLDSAGLLTVSTPEPASMAVFALGGGLLLLRRKRRAAL